VQDWYAEQDPSARPRVGLFANDTPDGTHWIGVLPLAGQPAPADSAASTEPAAEGDTTLAVLPDDDFQRLADSLREALFEAHREPLPLDATNRPVLERRLVELARCGAKVWWELKTSLPRPELQALKEALSTPSVVMIARCHRDRRATMPWAAVYDRRIDTTPDAPHRLCTEWQAVVDPGASGCTCDPQDGTIVCPWGFWGFRHEVEQPIKQIVGADAGTVPAELRRATFAEGTRVPIVPDRPSALVAFDPRVDPIGRHADVLGALLGVAPTGHVEELKRRLEAGGSGVVYVLCHGVELDDDLALQYADEAGDVHPLPADAIWGDDADPTPFLAFLNACESAAVTPERAQRWMQALPALGAIGVVGTEVKVRATFATDVAEAVIRALHEGRTLGQAFLGLRRRLLRDSLDPSGLLYTYHASADLHLHPASGCPVCAAAE
jgi:hypothetical protein